MKKKEVRFALNPNLLSFDHSARDLAGDGVGQDLVDGSCYGRESNQE